MQPLKHGVNGAVRRSCLRCEECLAHRVLKAIDVDACKLGRFCFVSVNDSPQQIEMLANMVLKIGQPIQDHAPDACGQIVVPDQDVFKVRVRRRGIDTLVDTGVQPQGFNHGRGTDIKVLHRAHHLTQVLLGGGGSNPRSTSGSQGFQLGPNLRNKRQIRYFNTGGKRPAPGICDHQPVQLKPFQGFPNRGSPDLQLLGKLIIIQQVPGPDFQHQEPVAKAFIGDVSQGFFRGIASDCQSSKSHGPIPFFTTKKPIDLLQPPVYADSNPNISVQDARIYLKEAT
jgi:hypothetical protein